ncbi:inositol-tetrakisphosphate 1-kinase 1-like [Fagus crenata]
MSSPSSRYRIGYALSLKKEQSFIQNSLINHANQRGIDLIRVDPSKPLTQQGPFDIIIHKLYAPDWNHQLQQISLQHPNVVVIDPPEAIQILHNRVSMLEVVTRLKTPQQGNQTFGVPNQRVVYDSETLMTSDSIEELGLRFPVIAKPVTADGSAKSHQMYLLLKRNGLNKLNTPIVLQEFVNHGGVIFKVYVVGKHVKCVKRKSLPDVSEEKLKDMADDEGLLLFSQISNSVGSDVDKAIEKAEMPALEFVRELAKGLREAMGLRFFNFDLIRDSNDGNRYLVIDINYFPGYAKMPEYESVLVDFFLDVMQEKSRNNIAEEEVKQNQEL